MGHHQAHGLLWAKAQPGPAHRPIKAHGPAWPMASIACIDITKKYSYAVLN